MKKFYYLIPVFTILLFSCSKNSTYYSLDAEFGLDIKDQKGKNLLDGRLKVEKITHSGINDGQEYLTAGYDTPDTPPIDGYSVTKKGESNILNMTFSPVYRESIITIKWKDIVEEDTLKAELYRDKHVIRIGKIFWNGDFIWEKGKSEDKYQINVLKDI
ncbi:hypothetical protein HMPREF0765_0825 [Sphingobacterium spiritivorum ATCC 33300]|uniref:Lipoprotein n=1 Tax=Sphingobacterium spiritivorum ATCC 33300 TaxID=525372 RepID=C2FU43_SPHSI|nr:hypothetical protein [Sphingobacterium spiritivorum]EEI93673.1 hypothetical protein HMPREF0765_0825 [Sphingobacterium spiritivorum ATCC 33300]QQS95751.1 hypothetical protein I6J03_20645 [Sphingobacterium spiritivorum]